MNDLRSRDEHPVEKDRHLLVAVDRSENSERAVLYVADFLGESPGFRVTLFHIAIIPQDYSFSDDGEKQRLIGEKEEEGQRLLDRYRNILIQAGMAAEKVEVALFTTDNETVAETILKKHLEIGSCTIVVGRKGKSREEEFLFGSVSSRIVRQAKQCSVWVIE